MADGTPRRASVYRLTAAPSSASAVTHTDGTYTHRHTTNVPHRLARHESSLSNGRHGTSTRIGQTTPHRRRARGCHRHAWTGASAPSASGRVAGAARLARSRRMPRPRAIGRYGRPVMPTAEMVAAAWARGVGARRGAHRHCDEGGGLYVCEDRPSPPLSSQRHTHRRWIV